MHINVVACARLELLSDVLVCCRHTTQEEVDQAGTAIVREATTMLAAGKKR